LIASAFVTVQGHHIFVGSKVPNLLPMTLTVFGAYILFYVAFSRTLRLHHFAKYGDFSYGLYLYAFPVQQLLVEHFRHSFNAVTLFLAAWAVTFCLAVLSWKFVEQPFMKMKQRAPRSAAKLGEVEGDAPRVPAPEVAGGVR